MLPISVAAAYITDLQSSYFIISDEATYNNQFFSTASSPLLPLKKNNMCKPDLRQTAKGTGATPPTS